MWNKMQVGTRGLHFYVVDFIGLVDIYLSKMP